MIQITHARGPAAVLLAVALGLASIAPCVAAETPTSKPPNAPLAPRPVTESAMAAVARLETRPEARFAHASAPAEESTGGSFFKSRKGALVLVLMAVGTGYAIYSASSERIENPVR